MLRLQAGILTAVIIVEKRFSRTVRYEAAIAELLVLTVEIALIVGYIWSKSNLMWWLAADLVFLSPLKAGRAFFYELIVSDPQSVKIRYVFRYFRRGWLRALSWRTGLWIRYALWWCLCALPALSVDIFRSLPSTIAFTSADELWDIALLLISYLLWVGGGIAAFVLCSRYQSTVYLLPYHKANSHLFKTRPSSVTLNSCLRYWITFPLFALIVPYFFAAFAFRTEQARSVRQEKDEIIKRNSFSPCKVEKVMIE